MVFNALCNVGGGGNDGCAARMMVMQLGTNDNENWVLEGPNPKSELTRT